jgi:hypothetical protein
MIVRASALRAVNLFDPDLNAVEDWDLWRRLLWSHKFYLLDEVLAKYRRHTSNMSRRRGWMMLRESKHVWKLTFDTPRHLRHMVPIAWKGLAFRYFAIVYESANEKSGSIPRRAVRKLRLALSR